MTAQLRERSSVLFTTEARRASVAGFNRAPARTHEHTHTGPNRLKGGLTPGWTLSHKTGTGQELGGVQAGYNDVGILTAPDGKKSESP